jgi:hypothetical protein
MNNLEPLSDCHEQMVAEENSEESLRIFSQGDVLMKNAVPRHATDDEGEIHPKKQLDEAGDTPVRGMSEEKLPQEEVEQQLSEKNA